MHLVYQLTLENYLSVPVRNNEAKVERIELNAVRDMNTNTSANHFHIRWDGTTLDWECFESREEAEERATFLKFDGETFAVEEVVEECHLRKIRWSTDRR
jgi:hypothetical protein